MVWGGGQTRVPANDSVIEATLSLPADVRLSLIGGEGGK